MTDIPRYSGPLGTPNKYELANTLEELAKLRNLAEDVAYDFVKDNGFSELILPQHRQELDVLAAIQVIENYLNTEGQKT